MTTLKYQFVIPECNKVVLLFDLSDKFCKTSTEIWSLTEYKTILLEGGERRMEVDQKSLWLYWWIMLWWLMYWHLTANQILCCIEDGWNDQQMIDTPHWILLQCFKFSLLDCCDYQPGIVFKFEDSSSVLSSLKCPRTQCVFACLHRLGEKIIHLLPVRV